MKPTIDKFIITNEGAKWLKSVAAGAKRIAVLLAMLLVALNVSAQPLQSCQDVIQLNWTPTTVRADGSSLQASEIGGYEIVVWSTDNALPQTSISLDGPVDMFTHDNPYPDCGAGELNYSIATIDTGNRVSELSTPLSLVVAGGYQGKESTPATIDFDSGSVSQKSISTVPSCTEINQFGCTRGN